MYLDVLYSAGCSEYSAVLSLVLLNIWLFEYLALLNICLTIGSSEYLALSHLVVLNIWFLWIFGSSGYLALLSIWLFF